MFSKPAAALTATLTLAAAALAAQTARPAAAHAAVATASVAYVSDWGSGLNDPNFDGGSIFVNAVTGHDPGSGSTGTYNGVGFTNVPVSAVDAAGDGAFAGFDTVLLYEVCDIGAPAHAATLHAVNTFLENGGKVMIFDGDRCSDEDGVGQADYSGLLFPFTTNAPGPQGASGFDYSFVEPGSTLTGGLTSGTPIPGDEVGDSNVFTGQSGAWCTALQAENVNGFKGNVEAYARTANGGLAVWNGEDNWATFGPTAHLKQVFDLILAQEHNPDGLPCQNPASGIKLDPPTATDDVGTSQTETATVVDDAAQPRAGVTVTFTVLSGPDAGATGTGVTDASGHATFAVSDTTVPGTDTVQASFNDGIEHSSNQTTIVWTARPTKLAYSGPASGDFDDATSIAFALTDAASGAPLPSRQVTMRLGAQAPCTAVTDASGVASCPVTPDEPSGPVAVTASFAGVPGLLPSSGSGTFTVTREETTLTYAGDTKFADGTPATLAAHLREDGAADIGGSRTVQLTLGSGASAQSCTASLRADGAWACTIAAVNQPLAGGGTVAITGSFGGDPYYLPSSFATTGTLQYLTGRAYGLSADVNLLVAALHLPPQPDTGAISTATALSTATPCTASVTGLLITAHTLCPNVTVTLAPGTSTGTSSVQDVTIGIPGLPVIKATAVKAVSTSTCTGSSGSLTIANLTVGGVPVNVNVAPNTGINLGGLAKLILDEQTPVPGADHGLTVNALHLQVAGGAVDVVVASATSDAHNC